MQAGESREFHKQESLRDPPARQLEVTGRPPLHAPLPVQTHTDLEETMPCPCSLLGKVKDAECAPGQC